MSKHLVITPVPAPKHATVLSATFTASVSVHRTSALAVTRAIHTWQVTPAAPTTLYHYG